MITPLTIGDLSQATTEGSGTFDILMRATKAHLEQEFAKGRIKGAEYSTVYLGSLQSVMQTALQFLLQKDKILLDAQLVEKQIELAQVQIEKAEAELAILQLNLTKIPAEIALLTAQKDLVVAQTANEAFQGQLLQSQKLQVEAQTVLATNQAAKVVKEGEYIDLQKTHLASQTILVDRQAANALLEGKVLVAQECKLRAEFDVLMETRTKTTKESDLLVQKTVTERAQTSSTGIDDSSVVGRQKQLYAAQTDGFKRDAEQKAAKLLVDTWNVRRTTDEATQPNTTNMLSDTTIGRAINKLLSGVGA